MVASGGACAIAYHGSRIASAIAGSNLVLVFPNGFSREESASALLTHRATNKRLFTLNLAAFKIAVGSAAPAGEQGEGLNISERQGGSEL
jgi:hypothetical protein